jgi:hypothetical protein
MSVEDCTKPMRRKYWSEMEDKDRIVKLQEELTRTQEALDRLSNYVSKLMGHEHLNGRMVVRLGHPNEEESYGGFSFRVEKFEK